MPIVLKNLSVEGVRFACKSLLNKNYTFNLSFEDKSFKTHFDFINIPCMICKTYSIKKGFYEYGLNFVYLDVLTKKNVINYLKHIVVNLKRGKK